MCVELAVQRLKISTPSNIYVNETIRMVNYTLENHRVPAFMVVVVSTVHSRGRNRNMATVNECIFGGGFVQ